MLPARVESVPTGQDLEEGISNIKSPYVHSPPWLNLMCLKQIEVKKLFFFYPTTSIKPWYRTIHTQWSNLEWIWALLNVKSTAQIKINMFP